MRSLLPLLLLAAGCAGATAAPAPEPLQLRTWELPPGLSARLASSLNRALRQGEDGAGGRAVEGPAGSLVVVAPSGVLDGVDALVKRATSGPAAPPPRNVDLRYWVVRGSPAAQPSRGPGLDELSSALDAVQQTDGPLALTLVASRELRTLDGERGRTGDRQLELEQVTTIEPGTDTIVADVQVEVPGGVKVETRLALADHALAVLSQSGVDDGPDSLYVLVRPEIVGTP